MRPGRLLRLCLLVLPVLVGLAAGAGHHRPANAADAGAASAVAAISAPHQSVPTPAHDEATCAFCQAAIFPPCAPHPADVSIAASALVRERRVASADRLPHLGSLRPASSRAPPALRIV